MYIFEGVRSEVSKMSPDVADLHVHGATANGKLKKIKKPKYKDAISLTSSKKHTLGALGGKTLR